MCEFIIASFPRSGNHLVRYLVEFLTNRPTIGEGDESWANDIDGPILKRIDLTYKYKNDNPIAVKRHVIREEDKSKKMIYVFRDSCEAILRHALHSYSLDYILNPENNYLKELALMNTNLMREYSSRYDNDRLIIRFENFVFNTEKSYFIIDSLSTFLDSTVKNVNLTRKKSLVKNLFQYMNTISKFYSKTTAINEHANTSTYWRDKLTKDQLIYIESIIYSDTIWNKFRGESNAS